MLSAGDQDLDWVARKQYQYIIWCTVYGGDYPMKKGFPSGESNPALGLERAIS